MVNARYCVSHSKDGWETFEQSNNEDSKYGLWTISADGGEFEEAGIYLNFKVGKRDVGIEIPLSDLLIMAKAVVDDWGKELFVGVDTEEAAYGKRDKTEAY